MRIEQREVFTFEELSDDAKKKARDWWREASSEDIPWSDEWLDSARAFCDEFGVRLKNWSIGPWRPVDYDTDHENSHFRGRRLSEFKRGRMPTGYCGDCDFWEAFHDEFTRTGDAKAAFEHGLHKGFHAWRDDMEFQLSDESVDETIIANGYEFTADGERI